MVSLLNSTLSTIIGMTIKHFCTLCLVFGNLTSDAFGHLLVDDYLIQFVVVPFSMVWIFHLMTSLF